MTENTADQRPSVERIVESVQDISIHPLDDGHSVGVAYDVTYNHPDIPGPLYWHVLAGIDTTNQGTEDNPVHLLGIISESSDATVDPRMIPEGMEHVGTFDHPPTEEEKDQFVPKEFIQ